MLTSQLTGLESIILNTLKASGDWMKASDIARAIGRNNGILTWYDRQILEDMVNHEVIEAEQRLQGVAKRYLVYRAKDGK
jgi:hypothetical protein